MKGCIKPEARDKRQCRTRELCIFLPAIFLPILGVEQSGEGPPFQSWPSFWQKNERQKNDPLARFVFGLGVDLRFPPKSLTPTKPAVCLVSLMHPCGLGPAFSGQKQRPSRASDRTKTTDLRSVAPGTAGEIGQRN